jgi:hypothetical protein
MRLALLWLLLSGTCLAQANPSQGQNPCVNPQANLQSVALNASTTSAVQIIALVAGQKIYVCAITVLGGGTTPTFSLVQGTGTNCATGQTTISTAIALPVAAPAQSFHPPVGVTASGNALCTLLAGTSPTAKGVLSYVQQ